MGYFLNNGCYILGLTGPTGTVIDNNYAFLEESKSDCHIWNFNSIEFTV